MKSKVAMASKLQVKLQVNAAVSDKITITVKLRPVINHLS